MCMEQDLQTTFEAHCLQSLMGPCTFEFPAANSDSQSLMVLEGASLAGMLAFLEVDLTLCNASLLLSNVGGTVLVTVDILDALQG